MLVLLLGLLAPIHASGPTRSCADDVALSSFVDDLTPPTETFLAAYRANGPPDGVLILVPFDTAMEVQTESLRRFFVGQVCILRWSAGGRNSLYHGYFVPNMVDPSGNTADCPDEEINDIDPEALFAYVLAAEAANRGMFQIQSSILQSALTAYRYMGYDEQDAWSAAMHWHEISGFADSSARDPMFFLDDENDINLSQWEGRARVYWALEQAREAKLELANLAFSMAVDDFAPLLMMGGGMAASAARTMSAVATRSIMTAIMPGRGIWGAGQCYSVNVHKVKKYILQ